MRIATGMVTRIARPGARVAGALVILFLAPAAGLPVAPPARAETAAPAADLATQLDLARRGGVDAEALEDLLARGRTAGLTDRQLAGLVSRLSGLAAADLPWHPALDRMQQGLAKKAPPDRIESAVARLDDRIRACGRLVDESFQPAASDQPVPRNIRHRLIDQTFFATEKGVSAASVRRTFSDLTRGQTPAERLASAQAPLLAITSLTAEGVAQDQGLQFVSDIQRAGVQGRDMEDLGLGIAAAIRAGADPGQVREQVLDGLKRQMPPGQIIRGLVPPRGGVPPNGPPPGDQHHGPRIDDGRGRPGGPAGGGNHPPGDPGRRGRGNGGGGQGQGTGGGRG